MTTAYQIKLYPQGKKDKYNEEQTTGEMEGGATVEHEDGRRGGHCTIQWGFEMFSVLT